jgi:hypothetical protein
MKIVSEMFEELIEEIRLLIRGEEFVDEPKVPQVSRRHEKPKVESIQVPGKKWSSKDEEKLLKRWGEVDGKPMVRARTLAPEFPGRKPEAVYQKCWALKSGYKQIRVRKRSRRYVRPAAIATKIEEAHAQANQANGNAAAKRFWQKLERLYELEISPIT